MDNVTYTTHSRVAEGIPAFRPSGPRSPDESTVYRPKNENCLLFIQSQHNKRHRRCKRVDKHVPVPGTKHHIMTKGRRNYHYRAWSTKSSGQKTAGTPARTITQGFHKTGITELGPIEARHYPQPPPAPPRRGGSPTVAYDAKAAALCAPLPLLPMRRPFLVCDTRWGRSTQEDDA